MSLSEAASFTPSSVLARKPRTFKQGAIVKSKQELRLQAEIHPPLRDGPNQTVNLPIGTCGIVCGPAPRGEGHLVAFDYDVHQTATAIVSPDVIARL